MRERGKFRVWILLGLGAPLLFVHVRWATAGFIAYTLSAAFFGIAMPGEYPPFGTKWFWRTMPLILVIHSAIVWGLVILDLDVPQIHSLPRILYGFLAVIVMLEWKVALWLLDLWRPSWD